MRASTDQVRTATLDAVDTARHRATGLVHHGADLVGTTIERGANTLEGGVERVAEKLPAATVVAARPRRHRLRTVLVTLVVVAVGVIVARKLLGGSTPVDERAEEPPAEPTPTAQADGNGASAEAAAATSAGG